MQEPHTLYVVADTPAAAEHAAGKIGGHNGAVATYNRWKSQPLGMQSRFSLYGVKLSV